MQALLHHLKERLHGLLLQSLHEGFEIGLGLAIHKTIRRQAANGFAHVLRRQLIQRLKAFGHDVCHLPNGAFLIGLLLGGIRRIVVDLRGVLPRGRQLRFQGLPLPGHNVIQLALYIRQDAIGVVLLQQLLLGLANLIENILHAGHALALPIHHAALHQHAQRFI